MASRPQPRDRSERVLQRAFKILLAIALLIVLAFLGAAFLPRWWAQRVGNQVNGGMILGIILGLFYGFVFTVVPALTARFAFHKRRPLRSWSILGALTLVLAGPNLLTLGIVIGTGNAAHAGERILDVDAPGFRGATLAGVVLAGFLLALLQYQLVSRHRTGRQLERATERLAAREPSPPPPPEPPSA